MQEKSGDATVHGVIKLSRARPFVMKNQDYVVVGKSTFNRIVGDGRIPEL